MNDQSETMKKSLLQCLYLILVAILLIVAGCSFNKNWQGTWSTAPQLVEPGNMPPEPGLSGNTLRQVVCVSVGGDKLRFRFSNEFSKDPVQILLVSVAHSLGNGKIDPATGTLLKFKGLNETILKPGTTLLSDPVEFALEPRMELAITIAFGKVPEEITGHPGSRTTSYLLEGNEVTNIDFSEALKTDHWYFINGIDVQAKKTAGAIAVLGNSITDGRGSVTNMQNRWPDILAQRLLGNKKTTNISVLNMGIGGNCVLRGGLGPNGISRFERDILNQSAVQWLIILEGVNDLGNTQSREEALKVAKELIEAYDDMIELAHEKGIRVFGATITPIKQSFYYTDYREEARNIVNNWIRTSGRYDAVIDFDKVLNDPKIPGVICTDLQSGDFLHPNETGYQKMGESINLELFE
ncbi:MAG: SGNH/GDSL hydrolase family protein [Draconibacterium sp.]